MRIIKLFIVWLVVVQPAYAKIIDQCIEDVAEARNREADRSKGGPEHNQLANTAAPVRSGKVAFKHLVTNRGERSELAMARTEIGGTYWYGWSMMLPEDFDHTGSKTIVMQLASYPTPRNGKFPCNANGPFLHIDAEGKLVLHLQHAGDDRDMVCDHFTLADDVQPLKGKWIDFVMHAKWTGDKDGFCKLWMKVHDNNYFQKMDYAGRTWWNDEDKGPYFKLGAYMGEPGWKGPAERTLYTDEYRLGDENSSFDEVAPGADERAGQPGRGSVKYVLYESRLNRCQIPIMVYLPPGYATSGERYPVVYNLHGAGGGSPARQWDRVRATLVDAMDGGKVRPLIYVFVNGQGDTFYIDAADKSLQIESSVVQELIPFIDKNYRTIAARGGRATDGFSMGGFGCLMLALKHPDLFSSVVSYGAALISAERVGTGPGRRFASREHFDEYDPRKLVEKNSDAIRRGMRVRLVCGDADGLYPANVEFTKLLEKLQLPFSWVSVPGVAHDTKGLYQRVGLESLKFMEAAFQAPAAAPEAKASESSRIRVSDNRRFLVQADGKPFFYLADTAWELFHRLNREEAEYYLKNRAEKGFTVIQAVVLAELDGLNTPNANGDKPLIDNDPARPNEAYFQHVDWIVNRAASLGLYIGMLPTWGDKWNRLRGAGPEIFTPENAAGFGEFLGRRYKDKPIIWILGGDRNIDSDAHLATIRAMAGGLKKGDGGRHLMTFHPRGGAGSSKWFHDDDWLDFNMRQNGHVVDFTERYFATREDYDRTPIKPIIDGEPLYEDHPISFKPDALGHSIAADVRRPLYWNLFSGACGHTYGHHSVWQMWAPGRTPINRPLMAWKEALDQAGAAQMQHARRLLQSRPYLTRVPDDSLIVAAEVPTSVPGAGRYRYVATRDSGGSYACVYVPAGRAFTVRMSAIAGERVTAWWFDPRTGQATKIGDYSNRGTQSFEPPAKGESLDWILVLDDAAKQFPPPGHQ
jgi:enterochelin esterase-like enzyme